MANVFHILEKVGQSFVTRGRHHTGDFSELKPVDSATECSLVFIGANRPDACELMSATRARLILCDSNSHIEESVLSDKTLVIVDDPKLAYVLVAEVFLKKELSPGIHPSAVVAESANISLSACIGPFVFIGENCVVGDNTVIHSNSSLYDHTEVGANVQIHSGACIGMVGFGYVVAPEGRTIQFPHVGAVKIADNVVIGSCTTICRGALGQTVIGENTKVDNLVYIAHNVRIGKNCLIVAQATICGSCKIGDDVWIGPGVNISDNLVIENRAVLTMGSTVTKKVSCGQRVTGYIAQPHAEFMQKYLSLFE